MKFEKVDEQSQGVTRDKSADFVNDDDMFVNDENEESTLESSKRYYSFGLVSYSVDVDLSLFLDSPHIVNYAYIMHDKDIKADGSLMDKHYHILCTTKKEHSCTHLVALFNELTLGTQNTFCRPIHKSSFQAYLYLTHRTKQAIKQGKHQYNEEDIISNNHLRWTKDSKAIDLTIEDFVNDLSSDDFSFEHMCRKYGRDFMRNAKSYLESRERIRFERKQNK